MFNYCNDLATKILNVIEAFLTVQESSAPVSVRLEAIRTVADDLVLINNELRKDDTYLELEYIQEIERVTAEHCSPEDTALLRDYKKSLFRMIRDRESIDISKKPNGFAEIFRKYLQIISEKNGLDMVPSFNSTFSVLLDFYFDDNSRDEYINALAQNKLYLQSLTVLGGARRGLSDIIKVFKTNSNIIRLVVSEGQQLFFSSQDLLAEFIDILKENSRIQDLDLSSQECGNTGVIMLAGVLSSDSTALVNLNISNNFISDTGGLALVDALKINTTLRRIDLSGNKFISSKIKEQIISICSEKGIDCVLDV